MSNPTDDAIIEIILDHVGYVGLNAKYDTMLRLLWGERYEQLRHEWFVNAEIDWSPK